MLKLLGYEASCYHAPDAERPRMVPAPKWVKPTSVVPIFPGGPGVRGSRFPYGGIMLLLQDFDVESSCLRAVERGYKPSEDSTTKRLEPLLTEAGVDLNSCYFTNRFVGVRDADNQYGANPAWRSPNSRKQYKPYVTMSDDILRMQLEEQRPKLVLTYGTHVPRSLGLATVWKQKLIASATFLGHSATVAALLHPSFRSSNIPQIKYRGLVGHDAEVTIIKEALAVAGLSPGGGTQ